MSKPLGAYIDDEIRRRDFQSEFTCIMCGYKCNTIAGAMRHARTHPKADPPED